MVGLCDTYRELGHRIYAKAILACGGIYCRFFFRPAGRKRTYNRGEIRDLRKSYVMLNEVKHLIAWQRDLRGSGAALNMTM
jgi:hypothetical protein